MEWKFECAWLVGWDGNWTDGHEGKDTPNTSYPRISSVLLQLAPVITLCQLYFFCFFTLFLASVRFLFIMLMWYSSTPGLGFQSGVDGEEGHDWQPTRATEIVE